MKKINLEQGSDAWLSWRKTVITATDCPAIRGTSPWSTAYKVWQRKLGLVEEQKSNDAMERGKRLEPVIRERFVRKFGMNMTPVVVESSEYGMLGASLDGLSDCGNYILEIKTGGRNLHRMAQEGVIPEYYMDQMQHQLLVTKADKCFYQVGSEEEEEEEIVIDVYPDPKFEKAYIPVAREFWRCLAFNDAPDLQASDYKDMSDESEWKKFATEYRRITQQIKDLEEIKESHRKEILKLCGDQNCSGEGIRAMKTTARGRVDYDSIPQLRGIDLEKYRKESTTIWKILAS